MSVIPEWNTQGILPPIRPGMPAANRDRSPYRADMLQFIDKFGTNEHRINLVEGFLSYRKSLFCVGITRGFQWIDGSFTENVEDIEGRSPHDIDCITFYCMPDGENEESLYMKNPRLFEHDDVKSQFNVDSYHIDIADGTIDDITYWYSMWSHRRDWAWKGFIQLEIDPRLDEEARIRLGQLRAELQP